MLTQIKKATQETSKNTIYSADGEVPTTYDRWKARLLCMDYNWCLKQVEGTTAGHIDSKLQEQKMTMPQKDGQASTYMLEKKMATGMTYGDTVLQWIATQHEQQQSVSDAASSATSNTTVPMCLNPGKRQCIDSIITGTRILQLKHRYCRQLKK